MSKILLCPDCGKLVSTSFPLHDCKPRLLAFTSPTYLRRLVREINGTPDGVYWRGTRCNRARLDGATLQLRAISPCNWFAPTTIDNIVDAYGRNVCASRVRA